MVSGTEESGVSDRDRTGPSVYRGHLDKSMVRNPEKGIHHGLRPKNSTRVWMEDPGTSRDLS